MSTSNFNPQQFNDHLIAQSMGIQVDSSGGIVRRTKRFKVASALYKTHPNWLKSRFVRTLLRMDHKKLAANISALDVKQLHDVKKFVDTIWGQKKGFTTSHPQRYTALFTAMYSQLGTPDGLSIIAGNKTANLAKLNTVLQDISLEGEVCVSVPPFCFLSHDEVWNFLRMKDPQIETLWKGFQKKQGNSIHLTEEAKKILVEIQQRISALDSRSFAHSKLSEFLKDHSTKQLMVRSTGKEDSDTLANAGGNESVAAVQPNVDAIIQAMKTVISSYFSVKSLSQRLVAGDDIITEPFTPILIQVMVGEPSRSDNSKDISVAGVMFSTEAEGLTQGVTAIQATFGHNEGVVNSKVPCDTFFVQTDGTVQPIIAKKDQRLVPVNGKLELQDNPPEIRGKQVLPPGIIQSLKKIADAVENAYGKPMDIEWVYDPSTTTIHIVQARPIVTTTQDKPSYLALSALPENAQVHQCLTIGAVGGSVRTIQKSEAVIQAATLDAALQSYLKLTPEEQKNIKAVIVAEIPSATSHEATTFRGAGKVVFSTPTPVSISENDCLVIDPQQGIIVTIPQNTDVASCTVPGWKKHPLPALRSVTTTTFDEEFLLFLKATFLHMEIPQGLKDLSLAQTLEKIQSGDVKDAKHALYALVKKLIMLSMQEREQGRIDTAKRFGTLAVTLFSITNEFTCLVGKQPNVPLARLFIANSVEALIRQDNAEQFVDLESIRTVAQDHKLQQKIDLSTMPQDRQEYYTQLIKSQSLIFNETTKKNWGNFVREVCISGTQEELSVLVGIIATLQKHNSLGYLLNKRDLFPENAVIDPLHAKTLIRQLASQFNTLQPTLEQVQKIETLCNQWNRRIQGWENLDAFETTWQEFSRDTMRNYVDLINAIKRTTDPIARTLLLQSVAHLVDIFDRSIKAVTGSSNTAERKVPCFHKMLDVYKSWMHTIIRGIDANITEQWFIRLGNAQEEVRSRGDCIDATYETISSQLASGNLATQLQPTTDFSAAGMRIDSGAAFERVVNPQTLEDLFTLIHQNILVAITALSPRDTYVLPDEMQEFMKQIGEMHQFSPPNLVGIDLQHPIISANYNISLYHHSATLRLVYNTETQEYEVDFKVFGIERDQRMQHVEDLAKCFCELSTLNKVKQKKQKNLFECTIASKDKKTVEQFLRLIVTQSILVVEQSKDLFNPDGLSDLFTDPGKWDTILAAFKKEPISKDFFLNLLYIAAKQKDNRVLEALFNMSPPFNKTPGDEGVYYNFLLLQQTFEFLVDNNNLQGAKTLLEKTGTSLIALPKPSQEKYATLAQLHLV